MMASKLITPLECNPLCRYCHINTGLVSISHQYGKSKSGAFKGKTQTSCYYYATACISHVPAPRIPCTVLLLHHQKGCIWTGEGSGKGHKDDQRCGTAFQPGITKLNRLEMKWPSGDTTEVHKSHTCVSGGASWAQREPCPLQARTGEHHGKREGGRLKIRERQRVFTQRVIKLWSTLSRDVVDTSGLKKQPDKFTKQRFVGESCIL